MKKLLSILLIIALSAMLLAGCGNGSANTSDPVQEAASAVESAVQAGSAAESEPEVEAEQSDEQEDAESVEAVEEPEEPEEPEVPEAPVFTVEYPLANGDVTYDCFASVPSNIANFVSDGLNDFPAYQIAMEETGINLEWVLTTPESELTKLNLILASGEYPTFIKAMDSLYVSGRDASVEDEVAVDIRDMMEEHAPDYYAFCQENDMFKLLTTDSGYITSVSPLASSRTEGPMIRRDWLDDLGLEVPHTIDELNDVLIAFRDEKGAKNAVIVDSLFTGSSTSFDFSMRGFPGGMEYNYVDGKAVPFFENENFIPYLDTIRFWVESGFCDDYMTISNPGQYENIILNDNAGYWVSGNTTLGDTFLAKYTREKIDIDPIETVVYKEGPLHVDGDEVSLNAENGWTITTSCQDPEMALEFLNWFYTEDGRIAASFGREGEGLAWDENGEPTYSDLIMHNPDGYPVMLAAMLYVGYGTPATSHPNVEKINASQNNEEQNAASEIWFRNRGTEYMIKGDMTASESAVYAAYSGDIGTMVEEFMAKYITGEADMTDYQAILDRAHEMGIDEVTEVVQAAHERYLAR